MAAEEPVTSPDQHKPGHPRVWRIGGILVIITLVAMLFGNNSVDTGAPWLIGTAVVIALMLIADTVLRRNGLRD